MKKGLVKDFTSSVVYVTVLVYISFVHQANNPIMGTLLMISRNARYFLLLAQFSSFSNEANNLLLCAIYWSDEFHSNSYSSKSGQ